MKKIIVFVISFFMTLCLSACGSNASDENVAENIYKVGICNYVDDASLNQIVDNIKNELKSLSEGKNYSFEIIENNANADSTVMEQIIANFIAEDVDLMIGVATPVAMKMQAMTEDNGIPVVFAAVSDPVACGVVESIENPGANITGTSDYLDTNAIMNLIFAIDPNADSVCLLYDVGQDSSTTAILAAKDYLQDKGIKIEEYTGTNTPEIMSVIPNIKSDIVFTPSDNTVMTAELSIYEDLAAMGIKHYAGADSFALNGAFLGYGVDYANLGKVTGDMVQDILINGKDVSTYSVKTFDNGIATVNTEICTQLGLDFDFIKDIIAPLCTDVKEITTAENFE